MLINDLSVRVNNYRNSIDTAISRVLNRSWLVLGPEVDAFEKDFSSYLGVNFCRSVANGTDALELGLRAVGVQQNDKVATVANAGFYTSTALLAIGAIPLYMDVDLDNRVVTLTEIKRAIKEGVRLLWLPIFMGRHCPI